MSKNVNLVILCAGCGKRLRPLTLITPKPFLPISKREFPVSKLVRELTSFLKVSTVYLVLGYAAVPFNYVYRIGNIPVVVIVDQKLRGTAGHLKTLIMHHKVSEYILLVNGDLILGLDAIRQISDKVRKHVDKGSDFVLFACKMPIRFGVVKHNASLRFVEWLEKPELNVVMGMYLLNVESLRDFILSIPDYIDMNVFLEQIAKHNVEVYVEIIEGSFTDLGVVDDYVRQLIC